MDEIIDLKANKGHQGFAIKCIRGLRDMKQAELAELIGVSPSQMYKIEKHPIIDEKYLKKIAEALNVDIDIIRNFRTDCEIKINTFNDHSKQIDVENIGTNYNHTSIPFEKYDSLQEKLLNSEKQSAQKDLKIQALEFELKNKS